LSIVLQHVHLVDELIDYIAANPKKCFWCTFWDLLLGIVCLV